MSRNPAKRSFFSEALRLLIVVFGVGAGYQIGITVNSDAEQSVLGVLTAPMIGVIVGAGLGYSLGGMFARFLMSALDKGETVLDGVTPEELVAGSIGATIAAVLMAMVSWPIFLVIGPLMASALFLFLVLLAAMFGFRVGQHRRAAVLDVIGPTKPALGARRTSSARLIDTSVAIDGRIIDIVRAGFAHGRLVVCEPVLAELQSLADAGDARRRAKGRRGLETLEKLRHEPGADVVVIPDGAPEVDDVDAKIIRTAVSHNLAILTLDTGMARVAAVSGIAVQDLHALSIAMRPPVQAGDVLTLKLLREGKEPGQAVGYLEDGTMLVVEGGNIFIGQSTVVEATSILTTNNGRMVFAKLKQSEATT